MSFGTWLMVQWIHQGKRLINHRQNLRVSDCKSQTKTDFNPQACSCPCQLSSSSTDASRDQNQTLPSIPSFFCRNKVFFLLLLFSTTQKHLLTLSSGPETCLCPGPFKTSQKYRQRGWRGAERAHVSLWLTERSKSHIWRVSAPVLICLPPSSHWTISWEEGERRAWGFLLFHCSFRGRREEKKG